ncbi:MULTISPECIES: endolytic transglycosylase MltG [Enterovibrio]|uniref:Endolytic murein transglycosylase n=1 Tax=Enterovibrio norvegicus FF-454 TaxID=1185651 RepID=A0A1E5C0Y8_9GAMM|nr:endolytic transglycosylase MltG [Enterovibrio norvegicus]OEE59149.1 ABC transporter substrate-binding protein [Enterovibrio norvegicus FF-454]
MIKKIALILLFFVVAAMGGAYWVHGQIESYVNEPIEIEQSQLIKVPEGSNYHSFTRKLVSEGVIPSSQWARWAAKTHPELTRLKAGTYQIQPGMTLADVFVVARSAKEHQFAITFVEGSTFKEWRKQLAETPQITHDTADMSEADIAKALGVNVDKLEGLLLPETYHYVAGESDMALLKRASSQLQNALQQAWETREEGLPIKSEYDLLTLASIIEKETAVDREREKVASVFVNRLNKGMRLQTDPTVIYGMGDKYDGNIRKKDLRTPTPYNTYTINGLPPTPIAMPGKASIIAAANPSDTPYFYFVADGLGGHTFSRTLAEHNRAVRQYLKILRAQ